MSQQTPSDRRATDRQTPLSDEQQATLRRHEELLAEVGRRHHRDRLRPYEDGLLFLEIASHGLWARAYQGSYRDVIHYIKDRSGTPESRSTIERRMDLARCFSLEQYQAHLAAGACPSALEIVAGAEPELRPALLEMARDPELLVEHLRAALKAARAERKKQEEAQDPDHLRQVMYQTVLKELKRARAKEKEPGDGARAAELEQQVGELTQALQAERVARAQAEAERETRRGERDGLKAELVGVEERVRAELEARLRAEILAQVRAELSPLPAPGDSKLETPPPPSDSKLETPPPPPPNDSKLETPPPPEPPADVILEGAAARQQLCWNHQHSQARMGGKEYPDSRNIISLAESPEFREDGKCKLCEKWAQPGETDPELLHEPECRLYRGTRPHVHDERCYDNPLCTTFYRPPPPAPEKPGRARRT
jgi:hypothetical protein